MHIQARILPYILLLATLVTSICSCRRPMSPSDHDLQDSIRYNSTTSRVDSITFSQTHYYWKDFAMRARDSIRLNSVAPFGPILSNIESDHAMTITRGDRVRIADIVINRADSIDSVWIKVACDEVNAGWIRETELLSHATPDNPISQFIIQFSDFRLIFGVTVLTLSLAAFILQTWRRERFRIVHLNDIPSFYPTLFCMAISFSATLYESVQHFAPETWDAYYFHPTLNPFALPRAMSLFVLAVWFQVVILFAVIDDLLKQKKIINTLSYFVSLMGISMFVYLIFTISVRLYFGYLLLPIYWFWAIRQHLRHNIPRYVCGKCGSPLLHKGRCKHCGAINY